MLRPEKVYVPDDKVELNVPLSNPDPPDSAIETVEVLSVVTTLPLASYAFTVTVNVTRETTEIVDSVAVILAKAPGVTVMDEVASVNPERVARIV